MISSFEWPGESPADVVEALETLESALNSRLESALDDIGVRIRGAAQEGAPVDEGRLRSSLESVVEAVGGTLVQLEVGSNLEHAAAHEFGTDPFFPPPSELRGWAGRVLGDESAAYPVARSISETGIEEQPYLRPAFHDNLEWIMDRIHEAVENAFDDAGIRT